MIAHELINPIIPSLTQHDTVSKALDWMENLRVNELPLLEDGVYAGLVQNDPLLEESNPDMLVKDLPLVDKQCFVNENQHLYDIMKVAAEYRIQSIPVLDLEGNFKGVITLEDTITAFAQTAAVQNPGAILILSIKQIDYSLTEISRLIESDNGKILSSFVNNDPHDPSKIRLTVKVNKTDLSRITATLERFGYQIMAIFQETEQVSNDKERLDLLLKFLDI